MLDNLDINSLIETTNYEQEQDDGQGQETSWENEGKSAITLLKEGHGKKFLYDTENDYHYLEVQDGFAVLLKHGEDYLFRRQYRPPIKMETVELIYGKLIDEEEPLVSAIREVKRQTGYSVRNVNQLGKFIASPTNLSEKFILFLAEVDTYKDNTTSLTEQGKTDTHIIRMGKRDILNKIRDSEFIISSLTIGVLFDILITKK